MSLRSELNHTFAEIREAFASGRGVIYHFVASQLSEITPWYTASVVLYDGSEIKQVRVIDPSFSYYYGYVADSDDDYPYIPHD